MKKGNDVFERLFEQFDHDGCGFSVNENAIPPIQRELLRASGEATSAQTYSHSTWASESQYVKFWLLNDGTFVHVRCAHADVIGGFQAWDKFRDSGAIRVASEPDGVLLVDFDEEPTEEQVWALVGLAREHGSKSVLLDHIGDEILISSANDVQAVLRGEEVRKPSLTAQFHESQEEVDEATASQIRRKQKSIGKLFPQFSDRVKAVQNKGGLRLKKTDQDTWHWKIHSGTKSDVWYDAVVKFKNVEPLLRKLVADRRLWNKTRTRVNLNKLSREFMKRADLQMDCGCPAQKYWGGDYILSKPKYDAKYGDKEDRAPKIRNPKQYGAHCKHLQNLFKALPFYADTVAKWLNDFYPELIGEVEKGASAEAEKFKAAGEDLRKRKVAKEEPARKSVRPAKTEEEPREAEPRKEPEREPEREEEPRKEEPEREEEPRKEEEPEREEEPRKEVKRPAKPKQEPKKPEDEEDLPDDVEEPGSEEEKPEEDDDRKDRKIWTT